MKQLGNYATVKRRVLCLCFLGLLAFGFWNTAAEAQDGASLKLIYSGWPGWVPWEIAKQIDFFAQEGVAVDLLWMDYMEGMDAFAAGQAGAVCMTNGDALVTGAASGKPSTAIVLNYYSNGNDMVVGRPGLDSIRDLKGLRVGVEVGFVGHLLLLTALEAHDMSEEDVTLVNIPTNELTQALAPGSVDAITAWQPNSGQALKIVPGSIRLYSSADSPGIIYDLPNMTHFARVCCDMAKLYGCLFQTHGMVEGLRVAVRWNRRGLYRSRWGNYDLIPYPGLVAFSRGPAVADVLASRLQGRQVDKQHVFPSPAPRTRFFRTSRPLAHS